MRRRRRKMHAIAAVARPHSDRDAGMIVIQLIIARAGFPAAIAVADDMSAKCRRSVLGRAQIRERVGTGLDQDDLAVRAHGTRHVEIERGLLRPARILPGIASLDAVLVDLDEAAISGRARGKSESRAVDTEIGF